MEAYPYCACSDFVPYTLLRWGLLYQWEVSTANGEGGGHLTCMSLDHVHMNNHSITVYRITGEA